MLEQVGFDEDDIFHSESAGMFNINNIKQIYMKQILFFFV